MSHGPPKRSASKEDVPKQKCVAQTTIQRYLKQEHDKESTTTGTHNIPAVAEAIIISGFKTYNCEMAKTFTTIRSLHPS